MQMKGRILENNDSLGNKGICDACFYLPYRLSNFTMLANTTISTSALTILTIVNNYRSYNKSRPTVIKQRNDVIAIILEASILKREFPDEAEC